MPDNELKQSSTEALLTFRNLLASLNKLVPQIVVIATFLGLLTIFILTFSMKLMVGSALLIVLGVSLGVYAKTVNYGEAALALVAGLLTIYSVDWTAAKFVAFAFSWLAFSLFALIISSMQLASKIEMILLNAAQSFDTENTKEVEKQLQEISNDTSIKTLGPIKRAEVIRLFAFRNLPISLMKPALKSVEILSTITQVEHEAMALFVADVYKVFGDSSDEYYQAFLDKIYKTIRNTPVSPKEFIHAFQASRRLVFSERIPVDTYLQKLTRALESGIPSDEVYEYLRENEE